MTENRCWLQGRNAEAYQSQGTEENCEELRKPEWTEISET